MNTVTRPAHGIRFHRWNSRHLSASVSQLSAIVLLTLLGSSRLLWAANYTFTNTANGASGYWTNLANWGTTTAYPGGTAGTATDNAYLTNNTGGGSYTNILNLLPPSALTTLAISNSNGQAWLIVTNGVSAATWLTNSGTLTIGSGANLQIDNGGAVSNSGTLTWLGTNGVIWLNNNGTLITANPGTITASSVTGLVTSASATGGVWNLNGKSFTIGGGASFDVLTVNNTTITNGAGVTLGSGTGNTGNGLIISNGAQFYSGAIIVGNTANASNNFYQIGGGVSAVTVSNGQTTIGNTGAGGNTLTVTNANLSSGLLVTIGSGSSNNTASVLADTTWNLLNSGLTVGSGAATGNLFTVSGGTVTNTGQITVGSIAGNNSLTVAGGQLLSTGALKVGGRGTNNTLSVLSGATLNMLGSAGTIGSGANGVIAWSNSVVINGGVVTATNGSSVGGWSIGFGGGASTNYAAYNSLTISNGGSFYSGYKDNPNQGKITVGVAAGDSFNVYNVGGLGALSTVTNGQVIVGNTGAGFNQMNVSNAYLFVGGGINIGAGSNNTVTISTSGVVNLNGQAINAGIGGTGNVVVVDGGVVTNGGGQSFIGQSSSFGNSIVISNGGQWYGSSIEVNRNGNAGDSNNTYQVGGLGARSTVSNAAINVGGTGTWNGQMMVTNASLLSGTGIVGNGASNNSAKVLGGGSWNLLNNNLTVGSGAATGNVLRIDGGGVAGGALVTNVNQVLLGAVAATAFGNSLIITNGGQVFATSVTAGNVAGTNSVQVAAGGLLDANTLLAGNFTGNTISNVGGIYQFSQSTPTITPNGASRIAITDGTISFRDLPSAVNLTNNWKGSPLTNLAWSGNNTLRLNNSTATNSLAGGYVFASGLGSTNYAALEMINNVTAVTGSGLTFSNTASLLISNTTATISGVVTNFNQITVLGSTANFNGGLVNTGLVTSSQSTLNGLLTMNNGTLAIAGSAPSTLTGSVNLLATGTFDTSGGDLTVSGSITNAGTLAKIGPGALILTAVNPYAGATAINSGQVVLANAYAASNSTVSVNVNGGLVFSNGTAFTVGGLTGSNDLGLTNTLGTGIAFSVGNNGADSSYAGALSGSGSLTKLGAGQLGLSGSNTYSGGTVVQNGTLKLNSADAFPGNALTVNGGIFDQNGNAITVTSLNGSGGTITNAGLAVTDGGSYAGVIAGAGAVSVNGGSLGLSGANTHAGGTVVNAGTLAVGNDSAAGNGLLTMAGGTVGAAGARVLANTVNLAATGTFDTSGGDLTLGGAITNTGALVKIGTGTLVVNAVNSYSGGTVINAGTFKLGAANRLADTGAVTVNTGTFDLGGFSETVGAVTLAGGAISNGTLTGSSYLIQSGTISAVLAGSGIGLTKNTAGTGVLWSASSYGGATLISNGTLKVNGALNGGGSVSVFNGGTLGGNGVISGAVTINNGGHLAPGNSVGTNTVGTLTLNSGSVLDWEFNGSANDLTVVSNSGGLSIGGGGFHLYQEGGTTNFDAQGLYNLIGYSGGISGAVSSLAVLNQTQNRTYSFGTADGFVTLAIGGQGAGWNGAVDAFWSNSNNWNGAVAPVAYDTLLFDGNTRVNNTNDFPANTRFSGIVFTNTAVGFVLNGAAVNLVGDIVNRNASTQTINLDLVLEGGSRAFNASNGNMVVNGTISEASPGLGVVKSGPKTVTLAGPNIYSGGTVVNSGTLLVANTSGSGTGTGTVAVLAGATVGGAGTISGTVTIDAGGSLSANAGGMLTLLVAPVLNGTAAIGNGATLNVVPAWSESTALWMQGGTLVGGTLTNFVGGVVQGSGVIGTTLINQGGVVATGGELRLTGGFSGGGSYQASTGGTLSFATDGSVNSLANPNGTVRVEAVLTNNTSFVNAGTLALAGGTYQTTTRLTNGATAWIKGYGTINSAALLNQGTLLANGGTLGGLVVNGVFTNAGTVHFAHSVGTFNSGVVNAGAWITDPTTNVFNDTFTVTSIGSISASPNDVYLFHSNFVNQSTQSNTWDTLNVTPGAGPGNGTEFVFSGTGQTQTFFHVGLLLTNGFMNSPSPLTTGVQNVTSFADVAGFATNFALGELTITNTTLLLAQPGAGGTTNALFVNDLFLDGAAHLIISNNMQLYFVNSNDWTLADVTLLGNAQIHQLSGTPLLVIPEPFTVLLLGCGGLVVWLRRKR